MNLFERKEASKIRYICLLDMYNKIQERWEKVIYPHQKYMSDLACKIPKGIQ